MSGLHELLDLVATCKGPVEVVGAGEVAEAVRAAVGRDAGDDPATIVETTGTPEALADALARVRTLGTVVLAGPPPSTGVDLDVYADLHVRGLTLIGVDVSER